MAIKYVDLDMAKAMFPSRARTLDAAATHANVYSDISNEDHQVEEHHLDYSNYLITINHAYTWYRDFL